MPTLSVWPAFSAALITAATSCSNKKKRAILAKSALNSSIRFAKRLPNPFEDRVIMSGDNPYKSPAHAPHDSVVAAPDMRGRTAISFVLIVVGFLVLLLQNGQIFTSALVFLALSAMSLMVWVSVLISRVDWRRFAVFIIGAHLILMLSCEFSLPDGFAFQRRFNLKMEQIRQKGVELDHRQATRGRD